jgi:hypothetical protein
MNRMRIAVGLATMIAVVAAVRALAAGKSDPGVLNGVYRISWTEKELTAAGASPRYAHNNLGYAHGGPAVLTLTLRDGHLRLVASPPTCLGTYTVAGNTVSIKQGPGCRGHIVARWSLGHGQLRLRVSVATDAGDEIGWGAKPWKKIA